LLYRSSLDHGAFPTVAALLSPKDAAAHIGEPATGCGTVASAEYEANEQNQPTLLDLDKPNPSAIFTAMIYGENRAKFGTPETSLGGKRICVTGQISDYQGKPEIVLTEPSQLRQ
jgi:DNA/RNA endonuclease YhcR with UshA esterase domain